MTDSVSQVEPVITPEAAGKLRKKKKGRFGEIFGVLVIIAFVIGVAFYQEAITAFFSMRLWDKGAPGNTVTSFLAAGKKGDQKTADSYLGTNDFKPFSKNGQWLGYSLTSMAGTLFFQFDELAPNTAPSDIPTEFISVGKAAAEVKMPDAKGTPVKYRLEMKDGSWKIMEILAGHTAR